MAAPQTSSQIYQAMESHGIPSHLIEHIAKNVHRNLFQPSLDALRCEVLSPFERLFLESRTIESGERITEHFYDEHTKILLFPGSRFVLHSVQWDTGLHEELLIEGYFSYPEATFYIERFYYRDHWRPARPVFHSFEDYLGYTRPLIITCFLTLERCMFYDESPKTVFKEAPLARPWRMCADILDWFKGI